MGKILRKPRRPEAAVHLVKNLERNLRESIVCFLASSRVPEVQTRAGCRVSETCSFVNKETDRQPKKTKKGGGTGHVAIVGVVKQLGVSQIKRGKVEAKARYPS